MLKYNIERKLVENTSVRVWPRLFEQVIDFFLENHMMEDMVHGGEIIRDGRACKEMRVDFMTKDTCIETKAPLSAWLPKGKTGYSRPSDLVVLMRFKDRFNVLRRHFSRVILLIILPAGGIEQTERECLFSWLREAYRREIHGGMEIWTADLELQEDGIVLVDYHNESIAIGGRQ